jgi:choline-glycine betaine transporter
MLGMDAGVKRLSEINMIVAVCLFIFVILATGFVAAIVSYFTVMVDYVTLAAGAVQSVRAGRHQLFPWLDDILLGLVDCLVTLCRHVHRPHFQRQDSA